MTLFPPYRYGMVEVDLHRGGYPKERNKAFLKTLKLNTIVSLTPDPPLVQDICLNPIHIKIDKPKESSIPLTYHKVAHILSIITDSANLPCYIHCLDGSLVTSIVILCLRKLQCWAPDSYYNEAIRSSKDDNLSSEEREFVIKFNGELELIRLPKWLWGGQMTFKKHPTLKVKVKTDDSCPSSSTNHAPSPPSINFSSSSRPSTAQSGQITNWLSTFRGDNEDAMVLSPRNSETPLSMAGLQPLVSASNVPSPRESQDSIVSRTLQALALETNRI